MPHCRLLWTHAYSKQGPAGPSALLPSGPRGRNPTLSPRQKDAGADPPQGGQKARERGRAQTCLHSAAPAPVCGRARPRSRGSHADRTRLRLLLSGSSRSSSLSVTVRGWSSAGAPHQPPKCCSVTTSSLNYSKHLHNARPRQRGKIR